MARKFNVERALVLYQQHEIMRIRQEVVLYYLPHTEKFLIRIRNTGWMFIVIY